MANETLVLSYMAPKNLTTHTHNKEHTYFFPHKNKHRQKTGQQRGFSCFEIIIHINSFRLPAMVKTKKLRAAGSHRSADSKGLPPGWIRV